MNINLDELTLKNLKKLERDVAAAIDSYESRKKAAAIAELEAHARQLGFNLAELTGTVVAVKGKRAAAVAKYANPANLSDTWSGRGRKPAWFAEAIAAGTDVSELTI